LPDAALHGLNGRSRHLQDFHGKPLLINVWASWCGPCKQEMASLERLAWNEIAQHINIIGISTDDYRQQAQRWLSQSHSTISHFIDERLRLVTSIEDLGTGQDGGFAASASLLGGRWCSTDGLKQPLLRRGMTGGIGESVRFY
jgi:thiol-disulfide isomerase/thioredoxin